MASSYRTLPIRVWDFAACKVSLKFGTFVPYLFGWRGLVILTCQGWTLIGSPTFLRPLIWRGCSDIHHFLHPHRSSWQFLYYNLETNDSEYNIQTAPRSWTLFIVRSIICGVKMTENSANTPRQRNARACEACRASKSRCIYKSQVGICQRCEASGAECVVRTKARPMRTRTA